MIMDVRSIDDCEVTQRSYSFSFSKKEKEEITKRFCEGSYKFNDTSILCSKTGEEAFSSLQKTVDTLSETEYYSISWKSFADTVQEPCSATEFKWKIGNFSSLPKVVDTFYESPEFSSPGYSWCLRIVPNGEWVQLYLMMCGGYKTYIRVDCIVGVEKVNGTKDFLNGLTSVYFGLKDLQGWKKFLKMDELKQRKSEFYPTDTLIIWIWLKHITPDIFNPLTLTEKVGSVRIGGPWKKKSELKGLTRLSDDLKRALIYEEDYDVSIKVRDKTFKAHKVILKARSDMLSPRCTHETDELNITVVETHDCEPEPFEIFLFYLYTGKVEKLADTNMLHVYYIADKYNVQDLKSECVLYIKCSICVKTVCSIIDVAKRHGDTELLNCAVDYFTKNIEDVLLTDEWNCFIENEPEYGHELYELYLYMGKVEKLSDTNMFHVYYIADKYNVQDLKSECVSYIKCSICVKSVCSIIDVARRHSDTELLNCAVDYFTKNIEDVLLTDEWNSFIENEPEYGHELYEKAVKTSDNEPEYGHEHYEKAVKTSDNEPEYGHELYEKVVKTSDKEPEYGHELYEKAVKNSDNEPEYGHELYEKVVKTSDKEPEYGHELYEKAVKNSDNEPEYGHELDEKAVKTSDD